MPFTHAFLVPDIYPSFRCKGGSCRSTCCKGWGISVRMEEYFRLLGEMHRLGELGYPVLAGISRKSMIYKTLDTTPDDALAGTTALHWECLRQGASILRVHDTREAAQIVALYERYEQSNDR